MARLKVRVFVSATSKGLGTYREQTAGILRALDVEPDHQNDWTADYRSISAIIEARLAAVDAGIFLIGPAFGSAPRGQRAGVLRSYTQLEFDVARTLGLPMFIVRTSSECELDSFSEDSTKERWQQLFVDRVELDDQKFELFSNAGDLSQIVAEIVAKLPEVIDRPIDLGVLPTSLALLRDQMGEVATDQEASELASHIFSLLGLLTYATNSSLNELEPRPHGDFCQLHDSVEWFEYALDGDHDVATEFIPEVRLWANDTLVPFLRELERLRRLMGSGPMPERAKARKDTRKHLESSFSGLGFFQAYLIATVEDLGDCERGHIFRLHRGLANQSIDLFVDPESATRVAVGQTFLLSLIRREACEISRWIRQDFEDPAVLRLPRSLPISDSTEWFDVAFRAEAKNMDSDAHQSQYGRGPLLTADSWKVLSQMFLAEPERKLTLGSGFRLVGKTWRTGLLCNLYFAQHSQHENELFVVHAMKEDLVGDESKRTRFADRFKHWSCVAGTNEKRIVVPHQHSEVTSDTDRPFIASPYCDGAVSLEEYLMSKGGELKPQEAYTIATEAAESLRLCELSGVRLLQLPPRHLLRLEDGSIRLLGFDSAFRFDAKLPDREHLASAIKDWNEVAPELSNGHRCADTTGDVYALGALLQKLRGRRRPTQFEKFVDWWADPLECFAYHCLATDPCVRFQTVEHALMFLKDWIPSHALKKPWTVALNDQLEIGRFPITNFEYDRFRQSKYGVRGGSVASTRRGAPFAPVTGVSTADACSFCTWLGDTSEFNWRLPNEAEWRLAARPASGEFPWGDEPPSSIHRCNYRGHLGGTTVVGAFSSGTAPCGADDLAGNVWEWCDEPIPGQPRRVAKGGSFASPEHHLTFNSRSERFFAGRFDDVGFRVVKERRS